MSDGATSSSNCTLLELKQIIKKRHRSHKTGSNCTLLELKLTNEEPIKLARRFELHLTGIETRMYDETHNHTKVRIAPYWN